MKGHRRRTRKRQTAVKRWMRMLGVLLLAWFLAPAKAEAADLSMMEELEFGEIQQSVDDILGDGFRFKETVREFLSGGQPFTLEAFVSAVAEQLRGDWKTEKNMLLSILVLGIAAALLTNFSHIFQNQQIAEVSFEVTYLLLFLLLLQVFDGALQVTKEVLSGMQEFMGVLIPAFFLAVTMASGGTTAVVFYQFLLGLIYGLQWVMGQGLLPLIQVQMLLVFVNHLTKEEALSQMSELVTKVVGWVLKSMMALVLGFNTIQGLLSPAIDALKTTTLSRAAELVPGIGNLAGGVTDVLLGSAVLIKNGIGIVALVVLVLICLAPLAKLGLLVFLLQLAAALIQPVSDKRMVGCVTGVGEGIQLLFRVVFTVAVLFILTIVVVTVSVGGVFLEGRKRGISVKEWLFGWIKDIAFYQLLMVVVLHVLPEKQQQKYVQFFMGVVLIIVVISPVLRLTGMEGKLDAAYARQTYDQELQEFQRRQQEIESAYENRLEEKLEEELEEAQEEGNEQEGERGIERIQIEVDIGEDAAGDEKGSTGDFSAGGNSAAGYRDSH